MLQSRAVLGWVVVAVLAASAHTSTASNSLHEQPYRRLQQQQQQQQQEQEQEQQEPADEQQQQSTGNLTRPLVVAHRGASGPLPEHTKEAYIKAIEEGADFIECDVVVTRDLQLICRHEPNINSTTDAWDTFKDRVTTYEIDGENVTGIFATDLTLDEVRQLRAKQTVDIRNQSFNGQFAIPTFEEYIDIALGAGRPVGIYPETKHPAWHNQLPFMRAANTTMEQLIVNALNAKNYTTSAPYDSAAWRAKPIFLQSFEVNSLRRFADLTDAPVVYLLDQAPDPETRQELVDIVSDRNLAELLQFVTVISPWKGLLYNLVYTVEGTDANRTQMLRSSGLAERLKQRGFKVHAYTLRDEPRYVLPTCGGDIACEFRFLFDTVGLDGAFADWPGTLVKWVEENRGSA